LTVHKTQGLTFSHMYVDLERCSGSESPYVMLSHVRSLEGLAILQPFRKSKITCRPSQDSRKDAERLTHLSLRTS
ncbi:hypothetical protein CERSUDRAFT_37240, partial [Gelatoporia subvermispora B]